MSIARVVVDVPASQTDRIFDYLIPAHLEGSIDKGMRVIVPFGPRKIMGFVLEIAEESERKKLKEIEEIMDIIPALTPELLEVGKWMAEKTLSFYISAFQAMLPQVLKAKYEKELRLVTENSLPEEIAEIFAGRESVSFREFTGKSGNIKELQRLIRQEEIEVEYQVSSKATTKKQTMVKRKAAPERIMEAIEDLPKQATKQRELLEFFLEEGESVAQADLLKLMGTTTASLKALEKKQLIEIFKEEVYRDPYQATDFPVTTALTLTKEQEAAIEPIYEDIEADQHRVYLLHGVTGSGKTEIYLQSIQSVLQKGKEAIVLVPEIALTPQMVNRFKGRFGSKVAVLHSALSAGEKFDEWRKIQRKEVQVVVGARSAIFAPFENIGIIIIDEEHETSYKQEDHPRYHARDVAVFRGENHGCPVILGSATPMLESYARAQKGIYQLLTLPKRMNNATMPEVEIVDMRDELHAGNRTMFSRVLKEKIEDRIAKKEQIVLFLNRRGYSTFVMCRDCGQVMECPHCDIALTYHRNSENLKCHYCSHEEKMPTVCPSCESKTIRYFGTGTQKVEENLTKLIPEARVIRMDVDTTRKKGAHEKLLGKFGNQEADILLGTQMIAKGLDFPNVTLVGVLAADSLLHLPDFRSAEKTFQLITQVSGRAGRHKLPGEVVIQSYTPEHYSIELAGSNEFEAFYRREMETRKSFQYPPYYYLALITVSHPIQAKAMEVTKEISRLLEKHLSEQAKVLGPTPSPLTRIKDRYRFQCMIKYKNEPNLESIVKKIIKYYEDKEKGHDLLVSVDLQPYQLM